MSQEPNNIFNGTPSGFNNVIKDQIDMDSPKPQQPENAPQSPPAQPGPPIRPPLHRVDSRTNFPFRPPFPNQPGRPPRPPGTPPFVPRPPGTPPFAPRPQGTPPFARPPTPFPRPPVANQRPLGVVQHRPGPRPPAPEEVGRGSALDSTLADGREYVRPPSIAAMNNRSYSLSSNPPDQAGEVRRRSVDSVGERNSSTESLDRKPDEPQSRPESRMNKIEEDRDKGSLEDGAQKPQPTPESVSAAEEPPKGAEVREKPLAMEGKQFLDLGKPPEAISPARSEGDNDSGVDESTQGNEQSSNGESRSPRKSSKSRTTSSTPGARSLSRGSPSPSLKSPDSNATTPGSVSERKKVPMNKVQVGSAPSPNLKVVRSKIGSLENASYKPGGGNVKIESKKLDFKGAGSRIEAKNDKYVPRGGDKKIVQQKLQWSAKSKIGSLENTTHKPKGGDKKIESKKLDFKEKAQSKVGSKANLNHVPGGGDVKIETKKIELKVTSKVGSLDNVKHKPGGGDKKIFDDKEYLKQTSVVSSLDHSLSGSQNSLPSQPDKLQNEDENLNQKH